MFKKTVLIPWIVICLLIMNGCNMEKNPSIQPVKILITKGGQGNTPCIFDVSEEGLLTVMSGDNVTGLFYGWSDMEGYLAEGNEKPKQKQRRLSQSELTAIDGMITRVKNDRDDINASYSTRLDSVDIIAIVDGEACNTFYNDGINDTNSLQALTYELVKLSPLKLDRQYIEVMENR